MEINGNEFIRIIHNRMKELGQTAHDYQILNMMRTLNTTEMKEIMNFGNVLSWMKKGNSIEQNQQ